MCLKELDLQFASSESGLSDGTQCAFDEVFVLGHQGQSEPQGSGRCHELDANKVIAIVRERPRQARTQIVEMTRVLLAPVDDAVRHALRRRSFKQSTKPPGMACCCRVLLARLRKPARSISSRCLQEPILRRRMTDVRNDERK